MLLGLRCQQILANRCQCPNVTEPESAFCLLHNTLIAAGHPDPSVAPEDPQREHADDENNTTQSIN